MNTVDIIGSRINALTRIELVECILRRATERIRGYIVFANAHVVVSAKRDASFSSVISSAALCVPDGFPLAVVASIKLRRRQERLSGPDIMMDLLREAQSLGLSVYFFGGTQDSLDRLISNIRSDFPKLMIAGSESPPFAPLEAVDWSGYLERINKSRASLVFVGLGCPKQENWMYMNCKHIDAFLLGVGAAFDFHSGSLKRAPRFIREMGFEWLYRLIQEPKRLWKRYFICNSLFLYYLLSSF